MSAKQTKKKLIKEYKEIRDDPDNNRHILAKPIDKDIFHWTAIIFGPKGTDWEDGVFELDLKFKDTYPQEPPTIVFKTKVYHPNVYQDGRICLNILDEKWSPAYSVSAVLDSISSLFDDPNPESPANIEAANNFKENKVAYKEKVRQCVKESIETWEKNHPDE